MNDMRYFENTGKIFLILLFVSASFTIAGGIIFGGLLSLLTLGLLLAGKQKWEHNILVYGFLVLLVGMLLTQWTLGGFADTDIALKEMYRFLFLFAVFLTFRKYPGDIYFKIFALFISINAGVAILQFFIGIPFFTSHTSPVSYYNTPGKPPFYALGTFSHYLNLGNIMLLSFPVMLSVAFSDKYSVRWRVLFFLAGGLCFLAAMASMGRSVWLGVLVATGVFFLLQRKKFFRYSGGLLFIGLFAGILLIAVNSNLDHEIRVQISSPKEDKKFENKTLLQSIENRIRSINLAKNRERIFIWRAGLKAMEGNYWLGIGRRQGLEKLRKTYAEVNQENKTKYGENFPSIYRIPEEGIHNIYLQIWMDSGVLGVLGYFFLFTGFFLIVILVRQRKKFEEVKLSCFLNGITAGVTGFMIAGFFENNFYNGETQTLLFVWLGSAIAIVHIIRQTKKERL